MRQRVEPERSGQSLAPARPRVWIDDRHTILRLGMLSCLAANGCVVVGESSGLRPVPTVRGLDVLVFECVGPRVREAVRLTDGSQAKLVATVEAATEADVRTIMGAGVAAILFRDNLTCETVVTNVKAAAAGSTALPQDVFLHLLRAQAAQVPLAGGLTDRERDVLRLLAEGSDTHGIALDLSFSERTVKNVVHDILTKLNCRTRAHAVAQATRAGVI